MLCQHKIFWHATSKNGKFNSTSENLRYLTEYSIYSDILVVRIAVFIVTSNYVILLECHACSRIAVLLLQGALLSRGYKTGILNSEVPYYHFNTAVVSQIVKDKRRPSFSLRKQSFSRQTLSCQIIVECFSTFSKM